MATVAAVIPCYNADDHIADAIESILQQSRQPDDIIVVDDGSTDRTVEIARRYPVRILNMPSNRGAGAARNAGWMAASTDLVAWLDADDSWEPNHLEVLVELLEQFEEAAVAFSLVKYVGGRSGVWQPKHFIAADRPVEAFSQCLRNNLVPQMSAVVRRSALLEVGGYDESMRRSQDYDLWLRLSRNHRFVRSSKVTASYRSHPAQASVLYRGEQVAADHASRARLLDRLRREGEEDAADAMEIQMRELWEDSLRDAWNYGDKGGLEHLIAAAHLVPVGPFRRFYWTVRVRSYLRIFTLWGRLKNINRFSRGPSRDSRETEGDIGRNPGNAGEVARND